MAGGDQPVRKVTIVGGGTAGWMTAAVLSQWLSQVEITLVESEEIGTVGVGEATIPHIRNYLPLAGVDPRLEVRGNLSSRHRSGCVGGPVHFACLL